jgi:hypothetical protein
MDGEKIKNFLLYHFEKFILALIVAGSGFLIFQGSQLPNFLKEQQPERLTQRATQAKADIDLDHTANIIPDRKPTFDIWGQTNKTYEPVDGSAYPLPYTWTGPPPKSIVRRQDPELFPPRALIATSVATTISVRSPTEKAEYFLATLDDADAVEVVEKKERKPKRKKGGMDEGMMEEMMGGQAEMMEQMMAAMGGGMGAGAKVGAGRKFSDKNDHGFRPVQVSTDKNPPIPRVAMFVAGRAVVPHKELYQSYELALKDADGYMPVRDTPVYYNVEVQRADVTDKAVDQLAEADWVNIWDRLRYTKLAAGFWSGFAPEIVPDDYRHEALSLWLPPVLLDDYAYFASHPLIPTIPWAEVNKKPVVEEVDPLKKVWDPDNPGGDDGEDVILAGPGNDGPSAMADMQMGPEMGPEMDMGMGMGGLQFGRGQVEKDPVEHKLVRFYDLVGIKNGAELGRTYVYRLRYSVSDPNFPASRTLQPKTSSLAPDVIERVQKLMAEASETKTRSYERWSDWSAPSDPVTLAAPEEQLLGSVTPGTTYVWKNAAGKDVPYMRDPAKAKVIASQFKPEVGTRVPVPMEVTEGTVLSHKAPFVDVVDPITLNIKKLPDAEIVSGTTVVGIDGGASLKIAEGLTEPGMILLFDPLGGLKVTDDVSDTEFYRIYNFSDEKGE